MGQWTEIGIHWLQTKIINIRKQGHIKRRTKLGFHYFHCNPGLHGACRSVLVGHLMSDHLGRGRGVHWTIIGQEPQTWLQAAGGDMIHLHQINLIISNMVSNRSVAARANLYPFDTALIGSSPVLSPKNIIRRGLRKKMNANSPRSTPARPLQPGVPS